MKKRIHRRSFLTTLAASVSGGVLLGATPFHGLRRESDDDMVLIPAGIFLKGTSMEKVKELATSYGYHPSWFESESPVKKLDLPAFKIDRYPVSNKHYQKFCIDSGHTPPEHWNKLTPPGHLLDHPVCGVNQNDAMTFASWIGKRLPTEDEWEKAARGTDGRMYPWGDIFNPNACCWNRSGSKGNTTDPVHAHPSGASPYGVMDMAGNLFEWCIDGPDGGPELDRAVKYSAFLKGGAWITTEVLDLRCAARSNSGHINNASAFYGFRCVKDLEK